MINLQSLPSYVFPQIVEVKHSRLNGKILVKLVCGDYRIDVDGYWQSGKYPSSLLAYALRGANVKTETVRNILILGLGGGSVIQEINKLFAQSEIIGVEKDPVIVHLGKKYFDLSTFTNLTTVIADATDFVTRKKYKHFFNVILSDLFIGCTVPKSTMTKKYLGNIYRLLKKDGVYILNLPYRQRYKEQTDAFVMLVKHQFPDVNTKIIPPHLFTWAYKRNS